jgi:chemotaxis protein CheD
MIKSKNNEFGKDLYILYPGDHYATQEDCVIGTISASCMVICLYDPIRHIGGMGHFVIPGAMGTEGIYRDEIGSHGITSMEYLMGEIVKLGGDRKKLRAKIFGVANVTGVNSWTDGIKNSIFTFIDEYFRVENIPIEKEDIGGARRRKLYFFPRTGKVLRKLLENNQDSSEFIKMEQEYINRVFKEKNSYGKVIVFE